MEEVERSPDQPARLVERRRVPRFAVDEDAAILVVNSGKQLPARAVEISLSGCRLRVADKSALGAGICVEVSFRLRSLAFRFSAQVEWVNANRYVGLRFVSVSPRRMADLVDNLAELAAERASSAVRQAAKRFAEEAALAAKLEAELAASSFAQQPVPAALATSTPAQAQAANPCAAAMSAKNSAGRERREQGRHDVDTTATILLVNIASRLPGHILNLSMSGCRIRTDERFPVGIYTRVETEFHLEGLPFRLGGVVQAVQDRNHVGIRFLDMSERKREQLGLLIAEIEELREHHGPTSG